MARPSNPRKESRLFNLPAVRRDDPELAQQAIPLWVAPKGVDRFHSSTRVGVEHAVKIRNLMFDDGVLVSRKGTDLMGGNAASKVMQVIDFVRQGTKKVTIRFCLRHLEVFEYGSGTWRSFAIPLTGSERDYFAYTGWADKLLFSNGVDGLWEFDFKNYTAKIVPGAPGAKHLTTFGGRVVASAVTVRGNFYPLRVKWTSKNDYTKWDVINDLGAGEEDLYGSPGGATDEVMGVWPSTDESAWMIRSRSVWQMSVSGNALAPFRFSRILAEVGSPFRNTIVSAPAGIIFASRENIHIIDSGGHQTIGDMVKDEIEEEAEPLRKAYAAYDVGRSEYRFACGTLVWRYRFQEKGWTVDEYPFEIQALSRQIQGKVGIPIDSLPATIDELPALFPPGAIDDLVYQRDEDDSMMFVPLSTELVIRENESTQDTLLTGEKTDSEILIESGVVNASPMDACELHEMHLEYESQMEQELIYEATFDDGASFQPLSGPKLIEETFGSEILFSKVERVSRKLQIRLRSLTLGKLRILGFAPTIVKVNRIMAPKRPKVASISVLPSPLSLVVGGTQQLSITLLGPGGQVITGKNVTLISTNNAVATVSSTGVVRAVSPGSFAIVASVANTQVSVSGTITAATPAAVASVTVTPSVSQGATGTTQVFTATVRDANGNILIGRTITWGSSNNAVATATNGSVTLLAAGTVAISATSEGVTGAATLTVTASAAVVDSVTVTPATFAGDVGETVQLVASPKDASANVLAGKTITWGTSAPSVATVSATGLVTMVGVGSVTITATCETVPGTSVGTVTAAEVPVSTVQVTPNSFSVAAGSTQTLTVVLRDASSNVLTGRVISYASSNTSVATVNSSGVVTGVAAGSAVITVTSEGKSATAAATVTAVPVASVTISPTSFSIGAGQSVTLTATPKDASGNPLTGRVVTWGTSDPTKATVSSTGVVTGVAAGSVTITATSETKSGTSAGTIGAATYSALSKNSSGTYVPRPNPLDAPAALPSVFLDYTVPSTFASTVTLTNSGSATQNTNALQAQIDAAAARSGNSNIRLPSPFPHNTVRIRKHAFAGSKTVVQAVTLPSTVGVLADAAAMTNSPECQIVENGGNCHLFDAGADNTYFIGLKFTASTALSIIYDLINVQAPNDTILGDVPSGIWYDRCLVRGNDPGTGATARNVRNGIAYNGKNGGVVDCVIDQIGLTGTESHALITYNTPGPCKFVGNKLEATSIGFLIGGDFPHLGAAAGRPTDIEVRRNFFTRRLSWAKDHGSWDGQTSRGIKNQFETKNVRRLLFEGNILESNWADGQTGNILVIKSGTGNGGDASGNGSEDVTVRYNIGRKSTRAISLHGLSDEPTAIPAKRCVVWNNLFYDIGSYAGQATAPLLWLLTQNFDDLYIANNTVMANITAQNSQLAYPNASSKSLRFVFRDNITEMDYIWGDTATGLAALQAWAAPGYVWERNVTVMDPGNWAGSPGGTNQYDNVRTDIGFVDLAAKNFRLASASPYKGDGLGGADPGAVIDDVETATASVGSVVAPELYVRPGLIGFGTTTPAGRGGAILRVTNLNNTGAGSLRAALETPGPRTICFEVSGTITLASKLVITHPFCTIAGQTAPSPGILIKGFGISVRTHDVLLQHLRIRVGEPGSGNNDAAEVLGPGGYNVVWDHCSLSWGIDEVASTWYGSTSSDRARDVTFSRCIISEALNTSSGGMLAGDFTQNFSLLHSLLAHNVDRNAYFKGGVSGVQVNCVVYNWNGNQAAYHADPEGSGSSQVAVVGNVFKRGLDTDAGRPIKLYASAKSGTKLYVADNRDSGVGGGTPPVDPWTLVQNDFGAGGVSTFATVWPTGLVAAASAGVQADVLATAGARPQDRDDVDTRVVADVVAGTGNVIASQDDVGGFPSLANNTRTLEVAGLPADPGGDSDADGYTNLEEWLETLAVDLET